MGLNVLSEFLGTLFLVLLGNGVVAAVSYKNMFANQSGKWIVIAMGWGLGVMVGVIISQSLGGTAQLNPAVTVFVAMQGAMTVQLAIVYIIVQILGAMVAQVLLNFMNWKHIKDTELSVVKGAHCTGPAYANFGKDKAIAHNLTYELIGTAVLLSVILAFEKGTNNLGFLGPLPVTFLVMSIGMSLGSSTGYAINPARDLGPRLVFWMSTRLVLKDKSVPLAWNYSWVPVAMPILAGIIIGAFGLIGATAVDPTLNA